MGAALVLGTMQALCEAQLPIHVIGAIAAAEKYAFRSCNTPWGYRDDHEWSNRRNFEYGCEGRLVFVTPSLISNVLILRLSIDIATLYRCNVLLR